MGFIGSLLTGLFGVLGTLTQDVTNGASTLGTFNSALLPPFLNTNPLPNGFPWGSDTATNTNYYTSAPNTGVVRKYDFSVARAQLSPDGFQKPMIVVNGAFPGPTIEANWGDTIEVTVHNNIQGPGEPLSMHWHGFLQKNSQWMDGVPGYTECPLPPGGSFTYRFQADLYGTTLYHAHVSAMYTAGAFGPIVIYGPKNSAYDIDLGPVVLNDWFHADYETLVEKTMAPSAAPPTLTSDSNLINGKMNYNCSQAAIGSKCTNNSGVSKFKFTTGKVHRLRLINAGAEGFQQFSIDGHQMTVIANDFVPVKPYTTNVVTLGVGQRTDILVTANMKSDSVVYMRSSITCVDSANPDALALVYYDKANTQNTSPTSQKQSYTAGCANDPLSSTVPSFSITPPTPSLVQTIDITVAPNATGSWLWSMNGSPARTDYNSPVLLLAKQGAVNNETTQPDWNIYPTHTNSSYRFIVNNNTPAPHPLHFHGHNMYILAVGTGTWDGTIVNPTNPQRRDVQIVPANGYVVWQADADNPGSWIYHCHIAWHLSAGFAINVLENQEAIQNLAIPSTTYQRCRDWASYTQTTLVDQIDSGL